jgi:CheY-like chemotaxis protein
VESEQGQGSTFRVLLPRRTTSMRPPPSSPGRPPESSREAAGARTVLVVEDDPGLRAIIERILGAGGFHVLLANHGESALAAVVQHAGRLDLVVTDVVMPDMSGIALAAELRRRRSALPVLFVTAFAGEAGAEIPADAHLLAKPFTSQTLLAAVHQCLHDAGIHASG